MFSLLKHDVPVGKNFTLNQDGTLNSETNGRLQSALSTLINIGHISELKTIIENSTGYEHIVCGVSGHKDPIGVYPNAFVEGSIARDNKCYKFPQGRGLLVIDSDNITESVYSKLIDICPQIDKTESLEKPSSSSMIYSNGKWLRKFTGTHIFLQVKDGRDIKRTLHVLHKRAILQDYGQHRVSSVGGFLERSFIDTMLDKPSQPIYLRPNLEPGICQDLKFVEREGEVVLDTRKHVINLTDEEEEMYQGMLVYARFEAQAEMDAKRVRWVSEQPNRESAEKALAQQILDADFMIDTAHQGSATVHEILMIPARYDKQTCRDPFDNEGGSKTKAMIFTDQQRAMINSHAHGGAVYKLLDASMVGFGDQRVPVGDLYPELQKLNPTDPPVNPPVNPVQNTDIHVPLAILDSEQPIDSHNWFQTHVNTQNTPISTPLIFKFMMATYGITVGYNVITKDCLMLGQGIKNKGDISNESNRAVIHGLCKLNKLDVGSIDMYLSMMMCENELNPVTNWVGKFPWDGVSRIRALFETLNVIENDMSFVLFTKWMMGALRLAKGEINSFEHVLVLQAEKGGEGKTRWFNKLTLPELCNSMSLRLDDKDQLKEAISYWLVELGELDSTFKKSDIKHLMGFLSKKKDNIRLPYAKSNNSYQRRTSYFGTVNNKNFLIDDSGDRRFWILETGNINYEHDVDMQQVWAEVDTLTENEWLSREENARLISLNNSYKMEDPLIDMLESYFSRKIVREGSRHITTTQILKNVGIINPNRGQLNKAGIWLRKNGYKFTNQRINGRQIKGYDIEFYDEILF